MSELERIRLREANRTELKEVYARAKKTERRIRAFLEDQYGVVTRGLSFEACIRVLSAAASVQFNPALREFYRQQRLQEAKEKNPLTDRGRLSD